MRSSNSLPPPPQFPPVHQFPNKQPASSLLKKFQYIIATTTIYIANYLWEIATVCPINSLLIRYWKNFSSL